MMRRSVTLLFHFVVGVFVAEGAPSSQLKLFTDGLSWNNARAYCASLGMTLAFIDEPASLYIEEMMQHEDFKDNVEDDFWIGIFDSDISDERLSDSGYAWSTSCAPLSTSWTNWKSGEPQNTADSFCIAMFKDSPRWRSAKCNEERPFLCRQELEEACKYIPTARSKCAFSEDQSLAKHFHADSSQHCEAECEAGIETDSLGSRCWWYNYNTGSLTCTLSFGKAPPKCRKSAASTASGDIRRSCISFSIDTSSTRKSGKNGKSPDVTCSPLSTSPLTTTGSVLTTAQQLTTQRQPTQQHTTHLSTEEGKLTTTQPTTTDSEVSTAPGTEATTTTTTTITAGTATAAQGSTTSSASTTTQPPATRAGPTTHMSTEEEELITTQSTTTDSGATTMTTETAAHHLTTNRNASTTTTAAAAAAAAPTATATDAPHSPPQATVGTTSGAADIDPAWSTAGNDVTSASLAGDTSVHTAAACCTCSGRSSPSTMQTPAEIKAELSVEVEKLSSTRRKKESAGDSRRSSMVMATVGVAVVCVGIGSLLFLDAFRIYEDLRYGV